MGFTSLLYAPALISAALALVVAQISAWRQPGPSWKYMVALGVAVAWWSLLEIAWIASDTPEQAQHANQLQYPAIVLAPVLWLCAALAQTGHSRWLAPARSWPLLVIPAITLMLAYSYQAGSSTLLWRGFLVPPEVLLPRALYGPWFWVMIVYIYLVFLVGCALHVRQYSQSPHYRAQLYVTGIIPVGMMATNALYLTGNWPLATDPTPLGFAICFALVLWAMLRHRLLDLSPVGRSMAFDSLNEGVLILDARERAVDVNSAACTMLRRGVDAVLGRPLGELLPRVTLAGLLGESSEQQLSSLSGSALLLRIGAAPIHDSAGAIAGAIVILRDTTVEQNAQRVLIETQQRLQLANAELERVAHTDVLTGLANRRLLLARLQEEFARARRHGNPLALLMIDLDHFKQVNDTRGHLEGDRVLESTGALLRALKRPADVAARYGGEEFALLLPDTDEAGARAAARRVQEALRAVQRSDAKGRRFRVTSSVGMAMLEALDSSGEALIARADDALYAAKSAGRDRVCCAVNGEFELPGAS